MTRFASSRKGPPFSVTSWDEYPPKPVSWPRLNEVGERTVSPRILFMSIRRLTRGFTPSVRNMRPDREGAYLRSGIGAATSTCIV
ncbi:hypothetical protein HPB48_007040 [Haemaphysalis longicornis]|uniref:Uncharacterized protein n=1 Tax=Haemaphysalis longicornis TaxID=44386 RepID=A0A9J6FE22_HAELO|nr:hypothetical protein HPB48_007040 [Haemaphysalis longicornis]